MLIYSVNVSVLVSKEYICILFNIYIALKVTTYSNCTDGDVRLVGGASRYEGRVEVCLNRAWGTVCASDNWGSQEIKIVCNQIGTFTIGNFQSTLQYINVFI